MRKHNGRRRQRGHNRRNYNNINKNTVLESYGPVSHIRGNAFQLIEKYTSLASDASSNDDKVLAEAYLQFADHYYRLNKEIEVTLEAKMAVNAEVNKNINQSNEINETDNLVNGNDVGELKKPSRKERSFKAKEEDNRKNPENYEQKLPKKFDTQKKIDISETEK